MEAHRFNAQPARYKTGFRKSIFFIFPGNYLTISSTVKVYESQFGTDKIAHFFQQGYAYYKIYNRAVARGGLAPDQALRKAIEWGQMTERTFYGTLVSGVYSNADLCANFVGMKFYQNLTGQIKIGDETKPALLVLKDGAWTFNESVAQTPQFLVKPFLSDHLNEALNPSIFTGNFGLRSFVRRTVKKQSCKQWLDRHPRVSEAVWNQVSGRLRRWHGEDYGFTESPNFVTISNVCFSREDSINKSAEQLPSALTSSVASAAAAAAAAASTGVSAAGARRKG
jgi:hypothetical protein